MAAIELTVPVQFWWTHTDAYLDSAARAIYALGLPTTVRRTFNEFQLPIVELEILTADSQIVTVPAGYTALKTNESWEVLTDDEATGRGIPLPTPSP